MAQRNPRNQRYSGEGPAGKTKKSAASVKPKTQAASSVTLPSKPTTRQEKRAARKERENAQRERDRVRAQRVKEKEKAALIAAGIDPDESKKPKRAATGAGGRRFGESGFANAILGPAETRRFFKPDPLARQNPTYKRYKYIYWIMLILGLCVVMGLSLFSWLLTSYPIVWYIFLAIGFVLVIGAMVFDSTKIKPLKKAHTENETVKKSPKQIKHETEAKKHAYELAQAREAQLAARRASRRRGRTSEQDASPEGDAEKKTEKASNKKDTSADEGAEKESEN